MEERKPYLSDEQIEAMAEIEAGNWRFADRESAKDGAAEVIERVRDLYEAERKRLLDRIAELEAEVAEVKWERDQALEMEAQAAAAARELHGHLKETEEELRDERRRP